jgi:hypothetical protein
MLDVKYAIEFEQQQQYCSLFSLSLSLGRHAREMQEVINEPTNKYPDVFIRNLAQKHMEDKQVGQTPMKIDRLLLSL